MSVRAQDSPHAKSVPDTSPTIGKIPAVADRNAPATDLMAPPVDLARIHHTVREILLAVGENPDREGLRDTPDGVARMYAEVFEGLRQDPKVHLKKFFN